MVETHATAAQHTKVEGKYILKEYEGQYFFVQVSTRWAGSGN